MKQNPIIDHLLSELKPIANPQPRIILWLKLLLMSLLSSLVFIGLKHFRSDFFVLLRDPAFIAELAVLIQMTLFGFAWALQSAIPGFDEKPRRFLFILIGLAALAAGLLFGFEQASSQPLNVKIFAKGSVCLVMIFANSLGSIILGLRLLRKGACTKPRVSSFVLLSAAAALAIATQHLICPDQNSLHLLVWHLGALPLCALAAWFLGPRLLAW